MAPKRTSADLAMTAVKEVQLTLKEMKENLKQKQNILEKQKLDHDENVIQKEHLITKVSKWKCVLFYLSCPKKFNLNSLKS